MLFFYLLVQYIDSNLLFSGRFGYIRRDSDLDGSDPPQEPSTSSQDLITDPEFYKALQELEDEQREQEEEEQEVEEFEEYLEEIVDVKPIVSNNDNVNTAQHLNVSF